MNGFNLKKLALAIGSLAIIGAAGSASAFPQFTIQPGAIPGSPSAPGGIVADSVTGTASELLTPISNDTFAGTGILVLGTFNNGLNNVFGTAFPNTFNLYLKFSFTDQLTSGNFGQLGSTYQITSLNFSLYADPQKDGMFTSASAGTVPVNASISNSANDLLLGFGSLLGGTSTLVSGGGSNGATLNSSQTFALCNGAGTAKMGSTTLTSASDARAADCVSNGTGGYGTSFFTQPVPFYTIAFDEFNNSDVQFNTTTGQIALNGGSGNIRFGVPEPDSIALLGIAAVAAGLATRRRKA